MKEALNRISEKLRRAGASIPAPEITGTVEGSIITGLSIALAIVESEIDGIKEALAQPELCKYGQEPKSCTSSPMDCQCAIDATFAQPEQEPVAWANRVIGGRKWLSIHASKGASDRWLEYRIKEQAQSEEYEQIALYTTPPQHSAIARKPLPHSVMVKHMKESCDSMEMRGAFADGWMSAEAAHGIKE